MSLSEENIYLSLELFLDPPETNPERLKELLNRKIGEWNKRQNINPKYKSMVEDAKGYIEGVKFEFPSLQNQADSAVESRLRKLKNDVDVAEEDGTLEQVEYDGIVKRHRDFFSEQTIQGKFKLKIGSSFHAPRNPHEGFTPKSLQEMNEIDDDLKVVQDGKCKNLYDLLGLYEKTKTEDLLKKAHELADKNHRKPKGRAEVDAEGRLLRKAVKFFESGTSRTEYDIALKRRPFDELIREKFEIRAFKKSVTFEEYDKSVDESREIGFSEDEAQWYVYNYYCVKRSCQPPRRPIKASNRWQCPLCLHLNDEFTQHCRCGIPLNIHCPKCQREGTINDGVCTSCGFPISNMPNAIRLLEKAREKLTEKQIPDAEDLIRQANGFWRECPGMNEIKESLAELKKQQEKFRKQVSDIEKQIKISLARHNIYEAHDLFLRLRQMPNAVISMEAEEQRVRETITEVQSQLKKLHATGDLAEKMTICEDILAVAADCEEARTVFQQYPPLPPLNLKAKLVLSGIELNWKAPVSRQPLSFVIVRKIGGVPSSKNDGEILEAKHTGTLFVDQNIKAGAIYGYAVFTQRDQTVEIRGCRSELVQKIDDVQNVNIIPGNGTLTFSWDEQYGCIETRVTRFDGVGMNESGIPVPLQQATSFVDTDLENGRLYRYYIQSVFHGIDGNPVLSPGRKFSAKPQLPPDPVPDLRAKRDANGGTILFWTPPQRGEVLLFDLPGSNSQKIKPVEYTTIVELKRRFSEPLPIREPLEGQTDWHCESNGVRHILPVTFLDGIAVFGQRIRLTNISDVSNLQMQMSGVDLYLTWDWPEGLDKVLILYRHDDFPQGINDPGAAKRIFSKSDYGLQQGFSLKDVSTLNHYFSVHALIENDKKTSCSVGVKLQTAKTIIHYDLVIRRKYVFFGEITAKIELGVESGEARFPELLIKSNRGCPPLIREYGVPIMTIPATTGKTQTVPLDASLLEDEMYMKAFLKNASDTRSFFLEGPSQEKLKLQLPRRTFVEKIGEILRFFQPHHR